MFDFTKRAKRVINDYAPQEAKRLGHDVIGPEHVLLGLLREEDSVAIKILKNLNIDLNELRKDIERHSKQGKGNILIDVMHNPDRYQKVVAYSKEEAKRLKHNYVGTEHILLALLRDNNIAGTSLANFSVNYSVIKAEIFRILGVAASGSVSTVRHGHSGKSRTPALDEFTRDLTKLAQENMLLPVIGRNKEIERIIQILCRKTKNNPVLLGEAGVGKTAIVEGLAERIIAKTVPDILHNNRVLALDLASLVAGTKYRGEFEDRLKKIMREIRSSRNVIVFIDELHTLIGAGAAEGAIDAANMLKPALARGELQCVGATTLTEFRKYVEKDSALERRFQSILVREPSTEDSVMILRGLKPSFEDHHRVTYTDEAIELAVELAERHINDRFLPDKAIDVIDEAGSRSRLAHSSRPSDILVLEEHIHSLIKQKDQEVKSQKYERAAQIRDEINEKRELLETKISEWQIKISDSSITVAPDDIYEVVSMWTGVPLSRAQASEAKKLLDMEKLLEKHVVGQSEAVSQIARSVRRSRTGLKDNRRPAGSFIFLGPTGVGKTELARALSHVLFGDVKKLFRLDMSEYMEPHSISKLIGSPPGYVGYDDAGQLSEFVRRNPYAVILFDEVEKAYPDIFNILLQICDEGFLTDTHGRRIDFTNTIIIMTSNLGARDMQKGSMLGFSESESRSDEIRLEKVMERLKKYFNPEFLNRMDDIITFQNLSEKEIQEIISIFLIQVNERIFSKKLFINLDKRAIAYLTYLGYDEKYGARPLRRLFQKEIEDHLAVRVLEGGLQEPTEICISVDKPLSSKEDAQSARLVFIERLWKGYDVKLRQKEKERLLKEKTMSQARLLSEPLPPQGLSVVKREQGSPPPVRSTGGGAVRG